MTFHNSLPGVSGWMTYFVQVSFGYFVTWSLCALIQKPAVRLRLWRGFLFLAVAGWLALLTPASLDRAAGSAILSTADRDGSALHWSWALTGGWASRLNLLGPWALRLYLLILVLSLFQLVLKRLRLEALLRGGQRPSPELRLVFDRLCREMKVRSCNLTLAKQLRSPGTACWYRPHVFLPMEMVPRVTSGQLVDILRHELIHVRSRDYLWDRLAAFACRVVCFHPAVWLAYRQLRWETELACDQEVVADHAESRFLYAECLTSLAKWWFLADSKSAKGIAFSSSASLLATRVRALLREPSPPSLVRKAWSGGLIAVVVTMAALLLPAVGVTLYWSVPPSLAIQSSGMGVRPAPRVRLASKTSRVRKQRTLAMQPAEVRAETATPNQLSNVFADLNAPPMPVLANPDMPRAHGVEAGAGSAPDGNDGAGSVASDPIWDSSPSSAGRVAGPGWGDVAKTAIRIGLSVGQGGTGSPSERPDRDPKRLH